MSAVLEHRADLMERYGYLRARAARRFIRPGLDRCDLEQIAAIGLLKACDRYDGALDTPFEAFAWLFIVGELMHYVRDYERLVRAPRKMRELERRLQRSFEQLVHELGREPTRDEVRERAGCSRTDADEVAIYHERGVMHSLDALQPAMHGYTYGLEHVDDSVLFSQALRRLSRTERTVILAHYTGGFSQVEIAARLGFSRRHVSRLHAGALKKLRSMYVAPASLRGTASHECSPRKKT